MGNNLRGVSLLNSVHLPYHVKLGSYAAIDATKEVDYLDETWTLSYTVNGLICELKVTCYRTFDVLLFQLRDDICSGGCIGSRIKPAENNLLELQDFKSFGRFDDMKLVKDNETSNPWGDVTKTKVIFYGSGNKGGLLVVEQKIKNGDMKPYKINLAHYYAASSGNVYTQNKIDVGLSMLLNIRCLNKEWDITVEAPVQHPSSALFYMFEQVCKTGIWKPMACPHCAFQRQSGGMFGQSESEDSDSLPVPARLHGPNQIATSVLANDGAVRGNNNGNLFVRQFFYRGKH